MKRYLFALLMLLGGQLFAQHITVLPSNRAFSSIEGPQGAFRYQRQFYLIDSAELKASGLTANTVINSIGFTIGSAQNTTTTGSFEVYMQNTSDLASRYDTAWTIVTSATNYYKLSGLFPGTYEYQVIPDCQSPIDTGRSSFTMNRPGDCFNPTTFTTDNITTNTATFHWVEPENVVTKYIVEYKTLESDTWIADSNVTGNHYVLGGLIANQVYQWRVRTLCSNGVFSAPSSSDASFSTLAPVLCSSATGLVASLPADSTIQLGWTAVSGANYYQVRYKRSGTSDWATTFAASSPLVLHSLNPGTSYHWQVAVGCSTGTGAYADGTDFTTTGTGRCFAPVNLTADSITAVSTKLSWTSVPGVVTYTIRYRLKESITWANAIAVMTQVHGGTITITSQTGPYDIPFVSGNTFTYTGAGVYVAWQYTNATTTTSTLNTSLTNSRDSVIVSFVSPDQNAASGHSLKLLSTKHRPETHFGSATLVDNVEVSAVYALGNHAISFSNTSGISALITNASAATQTYSVSLTIKKNNSNIIRHSESVPFTLSPTKSGVVTFTGYTPSVVELDSIIVSVAPQLNENVIKNNTNYYMQQVTNNLVGYPDSSGAITGAGFNTSKGMIANRYKMNGCGRIIAAQVFLTNSAIHHPLQAVVVSAGGVTLTTSTPFEADSTEVNHYHTFYFTNPPQITNADYYIGLIQPASAQGTSPVGVQYENKLLRRNAYYRDSLNGSGLKDTLQSGRFMIRAEVIPASEEPIITGKLLLCSGSTETLTAMAITRRWADTVKAYSSQISNVDFSAWKALGTPDILEPGGVNPNAWVSKSQDAQREYLVLGYSNPAPINFIDIYQHGNRGAIDTVFVKDGTGQYQIVYQATAAPDTISPAVKHISFTLTTFDVTEIRIALNSPAVAGFNSIDAVAIGKITDPSFSFIWQPGGLTTQSISVSTSGVVTLTVTGSCPASVSANVSVAVQGTITVTASGPTTFCKGDSILLTSSSATGNLWSIGKTTSSIYVKDPGSYSVAVFDGCSTVTSNTVVIAWKSVPVVNILGNLSICPGKTTSLDAGPFVSYEWSTGASTRIITVSSPSTYTVRVTNADGCKATVSVTTVLGSNPLPSIAGNLLLCPGGTTVLDAGADYNSYLWSTGATSQTITVTTTGTYSVTVTNSGGCTGGADVTTTLLTLPSPTIVGPLGFCPGGSSVISVMQDYSAYAWTTTGSTSKSTTISEQGIYYVHVTDAHGCVGTASRFMTIFAPPHPVISGTLSFCGGSSTVLEAGLGYAAYLWSNGATTHSIIATTVGTFTVTVTNLQGCSSSTSATTSINGAVPATPGPITGATTGLCSTVGNIYTIDPVPNSSYYVWTVPGNATITNGQQSASIKVAFNNVFTSGNITVRAANACGISPALNLRTLTMQGPPALPGNITGQTSGVCKSNKSYSIASVAGTNTYTWTVPAGASITSGQGTVSITVNFSAAFVSGSICVTAANNCGTTAAKCISVQNLPLVPGSITGPAMVCARTNNVTYSTTTVPGAASYTWAVPTGWTIVSGQGTITLVVNSGTKAGNITVKANSSCGSSALRILAVQAKCPTTGPVYLDMVQANSPQETDYKVLAYPNPTTGAVTLAFTGNSILKQQLKVYDAKGRIVYSREVIIENDMVTLDLGLLAKGLYTLWIYNGKEQKTIKLIRQ